MVIGEVIVQLNMFFNITFADFSIEHVHENYCMSAFSSTCAHFSICALIRDCFSYWCEVTTVAHKGQANVSLMNKQSRYKAFLGPQFVSKFGWKTSALLSGEYEAWVGGSTPFRSSVWLLQVSRWIKSKRKKRRKDKSEVWWAEMKTEEEKR